jgi:hypothetical protein
MPSPQVGNMIVELASEFCIRLLVVDTINRSKGPSNLTLVRPVHQSRKLNSP